MENKSEIFGEKFKISAKDEGLKFLDLVNKDIIYR